MKHYSNAIAASVIVLLLGAGITGRIHVQKKRFDQAVEEAMKTSEGYDQKFINMVNRMEDILASRAAFGYIGGKDPMTGKMRSVAKVAPVILVTKQSAPSVAAPPKDPFKLTAIISGEEANTFTAIIMIEERSLAVAQGDKAGGRRVVKITNERIEMENDSLLFFYDINGRTGQKSKMEQE
ncbi:MAG: hypothetical protein JW795_15135 [Chitinivibrionales bacterium]|nr:hypothetical protein [Chitinivibrionales bacterium]